MPFLGLFQFSQLSGLSLNSFIESLVFVVVVDVVRLQLQSHTLGDLSALLLLAVLIGDSNKLRVVSVRPGGVSTVSHNFIRSTLNIISNSPRNIHRPYQKPML